jgi:hypothetical protein
MLQVFVAKFKKAAHLEFVTVIAKFQMFLVLELYFVINIFLLSF